MNLGQFLSHKEAQKAQMIFANAFVLSWLDYST
jgi:hypothetical protein